MAARRPSPREDVQPTSDQNGRRLRALIDTAPEAVVVMDGQGHVVEWSQAAEQLFGWTRLDAVGRALDCLLLSREEAGASTRRALRRFIATGGGRAHSRRMEFTASRREGGAVPVELHLSRVLLDGETAVNAFLRDLTEQKATERQLAQRTAENRLLHEAVLLSTETDSFEDALAWCTEAVCETIGWTIGHVYIPAEDGRELISTPIWCLPKSRAVGEFRRRTESTAFRCGEGIPGRIWASADPVWTDDLRQDVRFQRAELAQRLGVRSAFGFTVRIRNEPAAVLEFFLPDAARPEQHLLDTIRSVGEQVGRVLERNLAEAALRESDDRLRFTLDAARVGTWDWNIATGEVQWSENLEAIHGVPPGTFGGSLEDLLRTIHPDDRDRVERALASALDRCGDYHVEYRVQSGETDCWVEGKGRAVCDERNRPIRLAGLCMDVTERKQSEAELRHAKEAAEAGNRAQAEFLANISHELRTPMNSIIGMTELALDEELPPQARDYLMTTRDSAGHLLRLLNELLDFARIETGKFSLGSTLFSLRETLDEVVKSLAAKADERGLELNCHVLNDVPDALIGDPVRLRHVLANLLGNAIKFTARGEVSLRVSVDSRTPDEVCLGFVVSDTGIGISPEDCERIFHAFSQVDSSSTRAFPGTGIGLAIAAELISMMGGRIWVESELGRGSQFHFTARFGSPPASGEDREGRLGELRGLRVLIVDDSETNRRILHDSLANWGMYPDEATCAEDALRMLRSATARGERYQAILLDALMPHVDGFTLAEVIQNDPELSGPTILMLSSADRRTFKERCAHLSVAAYLEKPIAQTELQLALSTALRGERLRRKRFDERLEPPARSLRILLAEDTPANQKLVQRILHRRGHHVECAQNGLEVLRLIKQQPFDAVLMDVQMPVMDGLQATAAIRALERSERDRIPIIAMTAHAMRGDRERCLTAGMDGYLAKPIAAAELIELVESLATCADRFPGEEATMGESKSASEDVSVLTAEDRQRILQRLGGDEKLYAELVDYFVEDSAQLLEQMRRAVQSGDSSELERAAHSLKGLAANFEGRAAVVTAREIEQCAGKGELGAAAPLIDRLEEHAQRLLSALQAEVGHPSAGE